MLNLHEPLPVIEAFASNYPVIVAGSTWEEDEEELDHYANTHTDIRFIIAPHEIDEDHLQGYGNFVSQYNQIFCSGKTIFRIDLPTTVELSTGTVNQNVLIIDNIGMLARLYSYAKICYVGGGFGDDGVHNVLEAAVYGKPVITGPVIEKYIEVHGTGRSRRGNHH